MISSFVSYFPVHLVEIDDSPILFKNQGEVYRVQAVNKKGETLLLSAWRSSSNEVRIYDIRKLSPIKNARTGPSAAYFASVPEGFEKIKGFEDFCSYVQHFLAVECRESRLYFLFD